MKGLKLYTAIAYGLIWTVGIVFLLTGAEYQSLAGTITATGCMLFPLVATLICQAVSHEPLLRNIGIHWHVNRWWFIGILLIFVIVALTILFTSCISGFSTDTEVLRALCEQMKMPLGAALAITIAFGLISGLTINALLAFGEEVGWRGYLLRQFHGQPFISTAIFIGLIWGLWHAPLILLGHNYPQHPGVGVLFMMLMCTPLAIIIQYVRLKSGSVIVAAIMHGTFNALAGLSIFFVEQRNELLDGGPGICGILALIVVAFGLFLYDRYGSKERLFTRPLDIEDLK